MEFGDLRAHLPRVHSPREGVRLATYPLGAYLFWLYSYKFLGMSAEYIERLSRDIMIQGVQQNLSHYSMGWIILLVGGIILLCFLLIQNEFGNLLREPREWQGYLTSAFGILAFATAWVLVPIADLSSSSQVPFFFVGGAVLAGFLLLQNNLAELLMLRPSNFRERTESRSQKIALGSSLGAILVFVLLTLNLTLVPAISNDIPRFLSIVLLITIVGFAWVFSQEGARPSIQAHRSSSLAYMVLLPLILYFLLRLMFLVHHPEMLMRNRWEIHFDFMDLGNTFMINSWPLEATATQDARWVFYKAAIVNSVRATLLSIVLCTVLGIIVGVTRLSSNKLASGLATVYVEVFRNLPLAVLLFLIATQLGHEMPRFQAEANIAGHLYYSNQGVWFTTLATYSRLFAALVGLALLRAFLRHSERVEPRRISAPAGTFAEMLRRPFSSLGWRLEPLTADLFLIAALVLLVARAPLGEAIFVEWLPDLVYGPLFTPFLTSVPEGNMQTLAGNAMIAVGPLACLATVVYALYIITSIDDDGMNDREIDDSEEGIGKRFKIWFAALAIAVGIAVSAGFSMPEYLKPTPSPGSWRIAEGTGFEITPMFIALIAGLTLFTASVIAEIVRGSIQSLPRGQVEAAISLGLNPYQRLRLVILPQALRSMVPLMNNQFMNVWKNSSLAIVCAYSDIFYVVLVMMNNVGKLIPLFILLLITYQVGSLTISAVMNWYNARVTSVKI